jgi:hypothetical protein
MTTYMCRGMIFRSIGVLAVVLGVCLSAPHRALALPEGRAYEMVSPVYKGGYGANNIAAVAPDGDSIAYISLGAFLGDPANNAIANYYLARRGASGWSSTPLTAPAAITPLGGVEDFSPTLESSLSLGRLGPSGGAVSYEGTEEVFLLHASALPDIAANFAVAGGVLSTPHNAKLAVGYDDASSDFSHIVFEASGQEYLLPEVKGAAPALYDLASGGGEAPLQVVSLNNKHEALGPACQVYLGALSTKGSSLNAVSADGGEVFFTAGVNAACAGQIFLRAGGSRTLEVSRPLSSKCSEVPCAGAEERAPAEFQGADEAGTKVFFTTTQPLTAEDQDEKSDLYMASIGCPPAEAECEVARREVTSLVQVSHDPHGEPAEVQGVVAIAPDGSRVYFVARGVLSAGANPEGRAAVQGADNLYVYDSDSGGAPAFIADLCSGSEASGVVEDPRCPADLSEHNGTTDKSLWTESQSEVQTNSCTGMPASCEPGRFLVFGSYGRLTGSDADSAQDVYRYDAVTGALERVSAGEAGGDANGNDDAFPATIAFGSVRKDLRWQHDMSTRAISADGSRIVFTTAAPLSRSAVNGLANIYEWYEKPGSAPGEGRVSLISTGTSDEPVGGEAVAISQTGADIFFKTSQGLVPQDTDGQADIYDARLGGGEPPPLAPRQPCAGEACQGPLTNPAPLLVPGSVSQAAGGNFAAAAAPQPVVAAKAKPKPKKKVKRRTRRARRSSASTRRAGSATGRSGR